MFVMQGAPVSFLAVLGIACNLKTQDIQPQEGQWAQFVAKNGLLVLMASQYQDNPLVFLARLYIVACAVEAGVVHNPGETWRIIAMRVIRKYLEERSIAINPVYFKEVRYIPNDFGGPGPSPTWFSAITTVAEYIASSPEVIQAVYLNDTTLTADNFDFVDGTTKLQKSIRIMVQLHLVEVHVLLGADVYNVLLQTVPRNHELFRLLGSVLAGTNYILHVGEVFGRSFVNGLNQLDPSLAPDGVGVLLSKQRRVFDYSRYRQDRYMSVEMKAYHNCLQHFVARILRSDDDTHVRTFRRMLSIQWNGTLSPSVTLVDLVADILMSAIVYHELYGHVFHQSRYAYTALKAYPSAMGTFVLQSPIVRRLTSNVRLVVEPGNLALIADLQTQVNNTQATIGQRLHKQALMIRENVECVLMH
jgi:hypothetical protein